jgi:hypothetical protein
MRENGEILSADRWLPVLADVVASNAPGFARRRGHHAIRIFGLDFDALEDLCRLAGVVATDDAIAEAVTSHIAVARERDEKYGGGFYRLYNFAAAARQLGVTEAIRAEAKLTTIGAVDSTVASRKKARRERDKESKAAQRREAGMTENAKSTQRAAPWEAEGISRATYYRRRKKGHADDVADETRETVLARPLYQRYNNGCAESVSQASNPERLAVRMRERGRASGKDCDQAVTYSKSSVTPASAAAGSRGAGPPRNRACGDLFRSLQVRVGSRLFSERLRRCG